MKAVILAAGRGTRLRPLTDTMPKCLVQVHGKPLLQYQLECLDHAGIQHCVIVVGYLADQIQRQFGSRFRNVRITYVVNERFLETNNLYSLWLARHELDDDILLMEGDLLFEDDILRDLMDLDLANVAVVDQFQSFMDGTVILADEGWATSMVLKSEQSADFNYRSALKTVNIYALSRATMGRHFLPAMDRYVAEGVTGQFYEAIMAHLIAQGDLQLGVHLTGDRRWTEIDTEEDLRQAEGASPWTMADSYADAMMTGAEEVAGRGAAPFGSPWLRRR